MVIPPTAVSAFCRRSPPFHRESGGSGKQQNVGRSCRGRVVRAGLLGLTEGGSRGGREGGREGANLLRREGALRRLSGGKLLRFLHKQEISSAPAGRPTAATAPNSLPVAQPAQPPSRRSPERKRKSASQLPHPCSRLSVGLTTHHSSMF